MILDTTKLDFFLVLQFKITEKIHGIHYFVYSSLIYLFILWIVYITFDRFLVSVEVIQVDLIR